MLNAPLEARKPYDFAGLGQTAGVTVIEKGSVVPSP